MKRWAHIFAVAGLLGLSCAGQARAQPAIYWNENAARPVFELRGWDAIPGMQGSASLDWGPFFSVFVEQASGSGVPPLTGAYRLEDGVLVFEPRYPLEAGLFYRAVFRHRGEATPPAQVVAKVFEVPDVRSGPATVVEAVYPSTNRLPENQLKFYIHFSQPMSRGEAHRRISLVDDQDRHIRLPFLEIDQELWDAAGRRLTLLFDPGRVKRELLPHREVGSALREGHSYALVVDKNWLDAAGRPLKEGFRKPFRVGPPDHEAPDEKGWAITVPRAGGKEALRVRFPEPMDHALLLRVIDVTTPSGERVAGTVEIDLEETRWTFRPEETWEAGDYVLEAATVLEDLAGNSLGRAFEVDVFEKVEETVGQSARRIRFRVAGDAP